MGNRTWMFSLFSFFMMGSLGVAQEIWPTDPTPTYPEPEPFYTAPAETAQFAAPLEPRVCAPPPCFGYHEGVC